MIQTMRLLLCCLMLTVYVQVLNGSRSIQASDSESRYHLSKRALEEVQHGSAEASNFTGSVYYISWVERGLPPSVSYGNKKRLDAVTLSDDSPLIEINVPFSFLQLL